MSSAKEIPPAYAELLRGTGPTVLSVATADGAIQSSLVWCDLADGRISISMSNTAPKFRRILKTGKASILKVDPANEDRYIAIRCVLDRVETEGALEHLDRLSRRHYGKQHWYGDVVPDDPSEKAKEVVVYLWPEQVYFT